MDQTVNSEINFNSIFRNLQIELQNEKFLFSCISEELIPEGLRARVNITRDVNDVTFVSEVQESLNVGNSRMLDIVYKQTKVRMKYMSEQIANHEALLFRNLESVNNARKYAKILCASAVREKQVMLIRKLSKLRFEKSVTKQF